MNSVEEIKIIYKWYQAQPEPVKEEIDRIAMRFETRLKRRADMQGMSKLGFGKRSGIELVYKLTRHIYS